MLDAADRQLVETLIDHLQLALPLLGRILVTLKQQQADLGAAQAALWRAVDVVKQLQGRRDGDA